MTSSAPTNVIEAYAADFLARRDDVSWLDKLRREAWAEFERLGFPTARRGNELWKYTDLRVLDSQPFNLNAQATAAADIDLSSVVAWDEDWHTAVFIDGQFDKVSSSNLNGSGVVISELTDAAGEVEAVFGSVAGIEGNPFVALNTALFESGLLVEISADAELEQPVHIVNIVSDGPDKRAFYPRVLVRAGSNSKGTVIESFVNLSAGAQLVVPVFEAALSEGANLTHFRVQLENENTVHIGTTRSEQPANAVFNSTTFATGPAIGRNDVHTNLAAEGAETTLHGLYITDGTSHQDNEISTTHQKPHGTSHQFYKGILAGKSRAVFSGKVIVQPGAMKTLAQQKDLNLLLSHAAEIDTKPSLEIYADDVQCAHGATAGHVDPEMLFFLMSRGVGREEASKMLITGFASEIVDEFEPKPLRDFLYSKLDEIVPALDSEGIL